MSDKIYVDGLFIKKGKFGTRIGVRVDEFSRWLLEHQEEGNDFVNIEIKESRDGEKMYAQLDTWKPNQSESSVVQVKGEDDDLPF